MTAFNSNVFLFCIFCVIFAASTVKAADISQANQTDALNTLNTFRRSMNAKDMMLLRWNSTLQQLAKTTFVGPGICAPNPAKTYPNKGIVFKLKIYNNESLNASSVLYEELQKEKATFQLSNQTCAPKACPYFMEAMYAPHTEVGCELNVCPTTAGSVRGYAIVSCLFNNDHNGTEPVFVAGDAATTCTQCPPGSVCNQKEKLCDTAYTTAAPTTAAPPKSTKGPVRCSSDTIPESFALITSLLSITLIVGC